MYFAQVDEDNTVLQVIVADAAHIETLQGNWVETDMEGIKTQNYAGIGMLYLEQENRFIPSDRELISRIELAKDSNGKQLYYKGANGEQKNTGYKMPISQRVFYLKDKETGKLIKSKKPPVMLPPECK